jgi:hypothetical protein
MKKYVVILVLVYLLSLYGIAKKSMMNPQLQKMIIQDLNQSLYGVIIKGGVYANHNVPVWLVVKNAGEDEIIWEDCLGSLGGLLKRSLETLEKGVPVIIEKAVPKKWGFRILFRTMEKIDYKEYETYWDKKIEKKKLIEVERKREIKKSAFYYFKIDFKFNEKYFANTPENIKIIHNTFNREFKFFKSKEEVLVYLDSDSGSDNSVEIGMSVKEVIALLGLPEKKIKFKNKMVYKYPDWLLKFEDDKVIDVKF